MTKPKICDEQPVSSVEWVHRDTLNPNDYNPNNVAPPELELLVVSILEDGFTQPIVILEDNTIVDGYHRWLVSGKKVMLDKYKGYIPVVRVKLDPTHRMMSTIRHNRARGTHAVLSMAEIVRTIAEDGVNAREIMRRLGMEEEEVDRLIDRAGMPIRGTKDVNGFKKSWVPE